MKITIFLLKLLFISNCVLATDTNWTFITKDNNGNYFATGYGNDTGNINAYCQKLNSTGAIIWQIEIGGTDTEFTYCVNTDGNNYYIGGLTNSYGFGVPGDGYIAKINTNGNLVWDLVLGEVNTDEIRGIVTNGNQVIVAGNTLSFNTTKDMFVASINATTGSVTNSKVIHFSNPIFEESIHLNKLNDGNFLLIGDDGSDILLIKFDSNLNTIFTKELSNNDDIQGISFTEDSNGNIYITGFFNYFNSLKDLIIKVDNQGNLIWSKYYDTGSDSKAMEIKTIGNEILVTGYTTAVPSSKTQCSAYKIDASGNLIFAKAFDDNSLLGSRNRWINSALNNKFELVNITYSNTFYDWNVEILSFSENSTSCNAIVLPITISDANVNSSNISLVNQPVNFFSFTGVNSSSINTFNNSMCEQSVYPYFEITVNSCTGAISTSNLSTNGVSYNWDFGDGGTSNQTNPTYTYSGTGTFTVTLYATDNMGNTDWYDVEVTIGGGGNFANAGNNVSICQGSSATLNASGGNSYSWSPSTGLSNANIANPTASPNSTTTYTVTVTNANGCTDTDQVTVTVDALPNLNFSLQTIASDNVPINLIATPSGGTFSGTGVVFNAFNPSLAGPGQHLVTYTYTDTNGCAASVSNSIFVFTINYNFVNYNLGTLAP